MRRRVLPESSEQFLGLREHLERSGAVWSRYRLKSERKVRKAGWMVSKPSFQASKIII